MRSRQLRSRVRRAVTEGEATRPSPSTVTDSIREPRCPTTSPSPTSASSPSPSATSGPTPSRWPPCWPPSGTTSLESLMDAAVPKRIHATSPLDLFEGRTEEAAATELRALAARNRPLEPMIGVGYHGTITPAVIRRNVLEDPSWYTAYTPYQPEISQGRLEALLNFQTMVADLTGHGDRQRVAARRGHGRGRGDDAGTTRQAQGGRPVRGRRRRAAPDDRGRAHPRRGDGHRRGRRRPGRRACRTATCAACWSSTRAPPAGSSTRASWSRTSPLAVACPSSRPTCWR